MNKDYFIKKEMILIDYLTNEIGFKRNKAKELLTHKLIRINDIAVSKYDFMLKSGDRMTVLDKAIKINEDFKLDIIYDDEDFIAINKPSGLLSISNDDEKYITAYRLVNDYLKNKGERIFILHRIDKDTSGVLVFSKKEELRDILQENWNSIVLKRGYYAIVCGKLDKKNDLIENYLNIDRNNLVYISDKRDKYAKKAITEYKVLKENNAYSLLDVDLFSGRKNQIRVTLGSLGHYVIGDKKYGKPLNPLKRLGLHAYELSFINPLNKKRYSFKAEMPEEFKTLFKKEI